MQERRRRLVVVVIMVLVALGGAFYESLQTSPAQQGSVQSAVTTAPPPGTAAEALGKLAVKGRAPKTDYKRSQFGDGWQQVGACDMRNHILKRDMREVTFVSATDCTVLSGVLDDPYTGRTINFTRGQTTSDDVQIDHVVALSDAWQKGAQQLSPDLREAFANDPLNLLAVDGPENQKKSDADAATWLPPNKDYRCRYVARQVAVKAKYTLWITQAEHAAIARILQTCPAQLMPAVSTG